MSDETTERGGWVKDWTEEVIYRSFDEGWEKELPVTLFTWADGSVDIHRQTGRGYYEAMEEALKIAAERGWVVDKAFGEMMMPSGIYQRLKRAEESTP